MFPLYARLRGQVLTALIGLLACGAVLAMARRGEAQNGNEAHPFPQRQKAPPLEGGVGWINTGGKPIELEKLRGKFVILDFWAYCCVNCMNVLPELKRIERAYPNEVVVIGVHSAKFTNEKEYKNIEDAVQRYEIEHPVVNDANMAIWQTFGVNSWPTIWVIDPEGFAIKPFRGETQFETLDQLLKDALPYYRRKRVVDTTPIRFELATFSAPNTPLRYPGKILADEASDRLFISDTNHNRIVVTRLDGTLIEVVGSGQIGKAVLRL